jgi:hypothetical protein
VLEETSDDLVRDPDGLPGSLALSHPRCGSPTCHCHTDAHGHPSWTLTFMVEGTKRVVHIPHADVDDVRRRVEAGNHFKAAVAEVLAINAQLMIRERPARRRRPRATPRPLRCWSTSLSSAAFPSPRRRRRRSP